MGMDLTAYIKTNENNKIIYNFAPDKMFTENLIESSYRATATFRKILNICGINFYEETTESGCIDISDERARIILDKLINLNVDTMLQNPIEIMTLIKFFKTCIVNNYTISIV